MRQNNSAKIDVLISVFAKPFQTALSLLSLLRYCGSHIDRIYFHEEQYTSDFERRNHSALLRYIADSTIHYLMPEWLAYNILDEERMKNDAAYRLSLRYQFGWENTKKKHALLIHNDIEVTGDVVGELLDNIGEASAVGELGQCWWCPAGQNGLCSSERYTEYKPDYAELMRIYNEGWNGKTRRAYHLGLKESLQKQPWPLPECRVNEWCMLVNLEKARPDTFPFGKATPIGGHVCSGAKIGKNWDEDVLLDTGVAWFYDMNHLGHKFAHYPVERFIIHDREGNVALSSAERYVRNEMAAKNRLQKEYPEFFEFFMKSPAR